MKKYKKQSFRDMIRVKVKDFNDPMCIMIFTPYPPGSRPYSYKDVKKHMAKIHKESFTKNINKRIRLYSE